MEIWLPGIAIGVRSTTSSHPQTLHLSIAVHAANADYDRHEGPNLPGDLLYLGDQLGVLDRVAAHANRTRARPATGPHTQGDRMLPQPPPTLPRCPAATLPSEQGASFIGVLRSSSWSMSRTSRTVTAAWYARLRTAAESSLAKPMRTSPSRPGRYGHACGGPRLRVRDARCCCRMFCESLSMIVLRLGPPAGR